MTVVRTGKNLEVIVTWIRKVCPLSAALANFYLFPPIAMDNPQCSDTGKHSTIITFTVQSEKEYYFLTMMKTQQLNVCRIM